MAKPLKDIVKKGVKSSKTSAENLGGLTPKAGDEKKFVAKHSVEKHEDRAGNGDAVFKGTTKEAPYNKQKDDVYEDKESEEASCNKTPKGTSCPVHGMNECMTAGKINEVKTGNEGHGYHGQAYNAASGDNKMAAANKAYSSAHAAVKKHAADHLKDVKNPNKMVTHYLDSKLGRHLHGNEHDAGYVKKDFGRFKKTYKPEMHEEVEQVDEVSAGMLNRYRDAAKNSDTSGMSKTKQFKRSEQMPNLARAKVAAGKSDDDSKYTLNRYYMTGAKKVKVPATEEVEQVDEVLSKSADAGEWIHDFQKSDNPKFAGKSKEKRKQMALAAYYAKQRNEEAGESDENFNEDLAVPLLGGEPPRGYSDEAAEMVKAELKALANKAMHLMMNMPEGMHVEPWVQAKIAQAKSYVSDVHDYCIYGDHDKPEEDEQMDTPMTFPNMSVDVNTGRNV